MVSTLQEPTVLKETVEVLGYILKQPKSEEILAAYLNTVFLRPDILAGLTHLVAESATAALADKKT